MIFTEWLTIEMQKRHWNQAELATNAGISKGAISHIFSGARRPGVELLKAIARALHLPTEQVYRAAGLLEPVTEETTALGEWIKMFVDADEETRDLMIDNARFFAARQARKKKV